MSYRLHAWLARTPFNICRMIQIKYEQERQPYVLLSGTEIERVRVVRLYECVYCGRVYDYSSDYFSPKTITRES